MFTGLKSSPDDFISQVAELREMEKTEVDRVAQGKVWTGIDAMENGLIDDFGTLDDAIELAAELAEMDDYGTVLVEKELDATEQLVVELLSTASVRELLARIEARPASPLEELSEMVERVLEPLALFNDPRGAYSHCFCTME